MTAPLNEGTVPAAVAGDQLLRAFEAAMKQAWQMVDPLRPPPAGSYYMGEHNGIIAALRTVRENFNREVAALAISVFFPEPRPKAEPFVTILRDSGRPELWLVVRDAQGCIVPLGSTGPVRVPSAWEAELELAATHPKEQHSEEVVASLPARCPQCKREGFLHTTWCPVNLKEQTEAREGEQHG